MQSPQYIIGIDEVGRGPIAGPVTVCGVCMPQHFSWEDFEGLKDSKKLSAKKRAVWFETVKGMKDVSFAVSSVGSASIDRRGIVPSIQLALNDVLKKFSIKPEECTVLLDGGLHAPEEFIYQKTIIRGDEKECSIALASVVAKVTRDSYMEKMAEKYIGYGFETHKGYGTKKHYEQITARGICDIHRRSFLKKVLLST